MATDSDRIRGAAVVRAAVLDAALIIVFAVIGRASHGEALDLGGVATTAWPFLVGAAVGWAVMVAWRRPYSIMWSGVGIWLSTVVVGMVLRLVTGEGIAAAFVVVAAIVTGVFLLGWRGVAIPIRRAARRRFAEHPGE